MNAAVNSLTIGLVVSAAAFGGSQKGEQQRPACMPTDLQFRVANGPAPAAARTGNILVANQFGTASLIDLESGSVEHFTIGPSPHNAALSPDGRWGVSVTFGPMTQSGENHTMHGNKLVVIDLIEKQIARTIDTGEFRGLHDVHFRPGHPTRVLVTAQTSRRVIEVDIATGAVVGAMDTRGDRSHMLAVTRDGNTVFTTNEVPGTISKLDVTKHAHVTAFAASPQVEGIAVTADGGELWVGETTTGSVTVRDAGTGAVLARFQGLRAPNILKITPDGRQVVISDLECATIAIGDVATRRIVRAIKMPSMANVADFSPDSRIGFVSLARERAVIALDLETGEQLGRYTVGNHPDGLRWGPKPKR